MIVEFKTVAIGVAISVLSSATIYGTSKVVRSTTVEQVKDEIKSQLAPIMIKLDAIDDKLDDLERDK